MGSDRSDGDDVLGSCEEANEPDEEPEDEETDGNPADNPGALLFLSSCVWVTVSVTSGAVACCAIACVIHDHFKIKIININWILSFLAGGDLNPEEEERVRISKWKFRILLLALH